MVFNVLILKVIYTCSQAFTAAFHPPMTAISKTSDKYDKLEAPETLMSCRSPRFILI